MVKKLDRELGIFAVFSISCGAMIGSGIFVLPGLAASIGGPAIFLAYLIAGLLVIPAALSKAEMATAMPESGGTYVFLDRSLGPLAGSLTGLGTWFSLLLKSAFALVGLSAYLMLFTHLSAEISNYIAVGIAILLVALNSYGAKLSGKLQTYLVFVTLAILVLFVGRGSVMIDKSNFVPFLPHGVTGFLSSVAFIFVSYAGVTKIASTAEEIRDPSRNIPWGIMLSLIIMMLVYTLVVYVIVGVVPFDQLGHGPYKLTPVAVVGNQLMGYLGEITIAAVAVLALSSMANAGLMSSSRYPLAMARDNHLPTFFSDIHENFGTPLNSIVVTGGLLVAFILLLPVKELAKLASAFKLLIFGLTNAALIVLRESEIEWYTPSFRSPGYPYLQVIGAIGSLGLLVFMGWYDLFPLIGSLILIVGCMGWYFFYAQDRMDRTGALYRTSDESDEVELFQRTRTESYSDKESVIVPFFGLATNDALQMERRIRLASSLCSPGERLDLVDFVEVPEQSFLSGFDADPEGFKELQERADLLGNEIQNEIHVDQVITHNSRGALRNYAEEENPHWVVFDWKEPSPWQILIGVRKWWLEDFPCDSLFLKDNGVPDFEDIVVTVEPGPYDGEILYAAGKIASHFNGNISFLNPYDPDDQDSHDFVRTYQNELRKMVDCETNREMVPVNEWEDTLTNRSQESDLILTGGQFEYFFFNRDMIIPKSLANQLECNFGRVRSYFQSPESVLARREDEEVDLKQFFNNDGSVLRTSAVDKEDLFRQIAETFDDAPVGADRVEKQLWDRENIQNTYIENGVAFPHTLIEDFQRTFLRVVILEEPLRYTSAGKNVSVLFVTVGPTADRELHLQVLRKMAGLCVETEFKEDLLFVNNYSEAKNVLLKYLGTS